MKLTRKEKREIDAAPQAEVLSAYMQLQSIGVDMASTVCTAPDLFPDRFSAIEGLEPVMLDRMTETCAKHCVPISIVRIVLRLHRLAIRAAFEAQDDLKSPEMTAHLN